MKKIVPYVTGLANVLSYCSLSPDEVYGKAEKAIAMELISRTSYVVLAYRLPFPEHDRLEIRKISKMLRMSVDAARYHEAVGYLGLITGINSRVDQETLQLKIDRLPWPDAVLSPVNALARHFGGQIPTIMDIYQLHLDSAAKKKSLSIKGIRNGLHDRLVAACKEIGLELPEVKIAF